MNITKEIKRIMQEKGITVTALNSKLNYKNGTNYTPQNLSKRLNKEDIKFGDALEILDVLGYTIGVREKLPEEIGEIEGQTSIFDIDKELNKTKSASKKIKNVSELDSYMEDVLRLMVTKYVKENFTKTLESVITQQVSELFGNKNSDIDAEPKGIYISKSIDDIKPMIKE